MVVAKTSNSLNSSSLPYPSGASSLPQGTTFIFQGQYFGECLIINCLNPKVLAHPFLQYHRELVTVCWFQVSLDETKSELLRVQGSRDYDMNLGPGRLCRSVLYLVQSSGSDNGQQWMFQSLPPFHSLEFSSLL